MFTQAIKFNKSDWVILIKSADNSPNNENRMLALLQQVLV